MRAGFAATQNLTDAASAARDLATQVKSSIVLNNNSCGIVFYDYDIDSDTFVETLHDELGFDIYGCSTFATLSAEGYSEMSAQLIVLTSDDCSFSGGVVPELKKESLKHDAGNIYMEASSKLSGKPKLIITFGNMINGIRTEDFIEVLSEMSDSCPIFGYIAADDSSLSMQSVAAGKHSYGNKAFSVLMIEGAINPEFVLKGIPVKAIRNSSTITKSSVNTVYEIGGRPPLEFLKKTGLLKFYDTVSAEELMQLLFAYPLLLEPINGINKDNVPVARVISTIDSSNETIDFFGAVPEGLAVSVCTITEDDIISGFEEAIIEADRIAEAKNAGCILAISCTARTFMLIGNADAEGRAIPKLLKFKVPLAGCYGFGEIVPTQVSENGANNALHNCTVGLCIL